MNPAYLQPTAIIDSEHPTVIRFAEEALAGSGGDPVSKAVKLYYAVRDSIWYDPYCRFYLPEHYRPSYTLRVRRGYCVGKATLLCALGRACGIPSRLRFADVRNHLITTQLLEVLGTDLFVYHGMTEFFLEGRWIKATPAFNAALCRKHRVPPLDFDGRRDSVFQAFNTQQEQFMEYTADHGAHADVPLDDILRAWRAAYGKDRVARWIEELESSGARSRRDFMKEEVVKAQGPRREAQGKE